MNAPIKKSKTSLAQKIVAIVLAVFGLMTLFMTTSVLLDLFGIRVLEGEYVEFIVWANFFSALGYLLSAWGFLKRAKWTTIVLAVVLLILIISFAALVILIYQGGNYETKTIYAMLFRIVLTLVFTLFSWKVNTNKKTVLL